LSEASVFGRRRTVEIVENEAGGRTVTLIAGEDLRQVPKSHRQLITSRIREAFADATAYFRDVADRCCFQDMVKWLQALLEDNVWELQLHLGYGEHVAAGFYWSSDRVRSAMIGVPSDQNLSIYPTTLSEYYSLVDVVDWMGFGRAGGFSGVGEHFPLRAFQFDYHGAAVDLDDTFICGASPCGDMLLYTGDSRGGWLNHGSHQIHLLGTIADMITARSG
jgi:hypothetical protein